MATRSNRRGASAKRNNTSRFPAWAFLAVGLVAGFFLGTLVPLSKVTPTDTQTASAAPKAAKPDPAPANDATRFDFYTLLPEREVIVPASEAPPAAAPDRPATELQPRQTTRYILQAGSFRRPQDADRRRAEVLLLGLDARVEGVDANGDRWHRVIVGPFEGRGPLDRARAMLISENIDTLVLQQKRG